MRPPCNGSLSRVNVGDNANITNLRKCACHTQIIGKNDELSRTEPQPDDCSSECVRYGLPFFCRETIRQGNDFNGFA